jgi:hypothetical protein
MTNKTYRFVTVIMVMLLVLGLALVACKSQTPAETVTPPAETVTPPAETVTPPAEQPATPPAAGTLSFTPATYTSDKYGFSIQYPKDWGENTGLVNEIVVAAFSASAGLPGVSLSVADADGPLTADSIVAQINSLPSHSGAQVTSDITPTTLADGTPASQYALTYKFQAYEIKAFGVSADKDGKRIRAWVWTIDSFSPYDEALFSEVAHTLSVK